MNKPSSPPKKQQQGGKNKKNYKVRNWREYNQALVDRGKIIFWITEEAIRQWEETQHSTKRGRPKQYSDIAIETALTLQQVFHLTLRQTEGFLANVLAILKAGVRAPDYSTLSLRAATLAIQIRVRKLCPKPLHIVVDSTGAKIYGEGEWKVRQHGWSKHRTWRKLHLGVDEATGDILMSAVTGNDATDSEMLEPLMEQVPTTTAIEQVSADGAFDKRICYEVLRKRRVATIAIPPQHNARIWQHGNTKAERLPRDENLRRIRTTGRKAWKQEINYHRRSLAETAMFRLKTIFTDKIQARSLANQQTQMLLRCKALNRMTMLGMPDSVLVG